MHTRMQEFPVLLWTHIRLYGKPRNTVRKMGAAPPIERRKKDGERGIYNGYIISGVALELLAVLTGMFPLYLGGLTMIYYGISRTWMRRL